MPPKRRPSPGPGGRRRSSGAAGFGPALTRGLFELLDANGDGLVEEHEWELGCALSRDAFGGRAQPAAVAQIFAKLDKEGTGALRLADLTGELRSLQEAMGIPSGQGLEALRTLQQRQARERRQAPALGPLDRDLRLEPAVAEAIAADEESAAKVLRAFQAFDTNKDGTISRAELTRLLQALSKKVWTEENITTLIANIDEDGNGHIDYSEFVWWLYGGTSADKRRAAVLRASELTVASPDDGNDGDAAAARICSHRRAHVLRRFLAMLATKMEEDEEKAEEEEEEEEDEVPLAIQAKRVAHEVVTGDALQPPPPEMCMDLATDALHVGGDSVWISVDLSVARSRGTDAEAPAQRVPVDLLVVVDISGSMSTAMPSVRKCLAALTKLFEAQDRAAVVKFDHEAEVVMPWTDMDEDGLGEFVQAQQDLKARGGTNFLPVFEVCFNELLTDATPGRARSALFISDGAPNENDSDILRAISDQLRFANISIIAAGFGEGTKADLMSAIAQSGCGPFVYIPDATHIPQQLGRIWASVAYTSVSSAFAVLRPLGKARVGTVEGAFGAAELCLRPDGRPSSQQVLVVQLGPVQHGASREVAVQLKLPPHLSKALGQVSASDLRRPLLEISVLSQAIATGSPVFMQRAEFCPMQVPSLLMETMLPFPVRLVLDNNLEEFDAQLFLKHAAETFGVQQSELGLMRLLRGSVIVDMHLKTEPAQASKILEEMATPAFRQRMGDAMQSVGWKLKSVTVPGQQAFRRILQTRLAQALGSAAKGSRKQDDSVEVRNVQNLAGSTIAQCLDPPGPASMASKVLQDCKLVLERMRTKSDPQARQHLSHDLMQLQAAHIAQYKCHSDSEALKCYERPEAEQAAEVMVTSCGDVSLAAAFWETVSESVEILLHHSTADQCGVLVGLKPEQGREVDFGHLMSEVCPAFQVRIKPVGGTAAVERVACAHRVDVQGMRPLVRQSGHPCSASSSIEDHIRVPYAQSLRVRIDPRSCSRDGSLTFYVDAEQRRPLKTISHAVSASTGRRSIDGTFWEIEVPGPELWFSFRPGPDPARFDVEWGYCFEVHAMMPETSQEGLLLQTTFLGLPPGPAHVEVRPHPQTLQVAARDVHILELPGAAVKRLVSDLPRSFVLNSAASQALGLASSVRLLAADGQPVRGKAALEQAIGAHRRGVAGSGAALQLVFTSDSSLFGLGSEALEKAKFAGVPAKVFGRLTQAAEREVLAAVPPELPG